MIISALEQFPLSNTPNISVPLVESALNVSVPVTDKDSPTDNETFGKYPHTYDDASNVENVIEFSFEENVTSALLR